MESIKHHKVFVVSKKIVNIGLGCIEFFFAFILFYLTIALIFMSIRVGSDIKSKEGITIYMKSDGIHTDFVFPVQTKIIDWSKLFLPEDTKGKIKNLKYIAVGWGDQGFFLNTPKWADLKVSTAFDACFYLGKTAIHTNYMKDLDFHYEHVKLTISSKQYQQLISYVRASLILEKHNCYICIKNRGYWDTDAFYESNGSYGLFNTCNSWVNKGLKEADLPACLWAPFNGGIFHKYR